MAEKRVAASRDVLPVLETMSEESAGEEPRPLQSDIGDTPSLTATSIVNGLMVMTAKATAFVSPSTKKPGQIQNDPAWWSSLDDDDLDGPREKLTH